MEQFLGHGGKTFCCDVCKSFLTTSLEELRAHYASHSGIQYKCKICQNKFSYSNYIKHHSDDKSKDNKRRKTAGFQGKVYCCNECSSFLATDLEELKLHSRFHSGIAHEKEYKCKICQKKNTWYNYLKHQETDHSENNFSDNENEEALHSERKVYFCDLCKLFLTNSLEELKAHHVVHRQAEQGNQYQCKICHQKLTWFNYLNHHDSSHSLGKCSEIYIPVPELPDLPASWFTLPSSDACVTEKHLDILEKEYFNKQHITLGKSEFLAKLTGLPIKPIQLSLFSKTPNSGSDVNFMIPDPVNKSNTNLTKLKEESKEEDQEDIEYKPELISYVEDIALSSLQRSEGSPLEQAQSCFSSVNESIDMRMPAGTLPKFSEAPGFQSIVNYILPEVVNRPNQGLNIVKEDPDDIEYKQQMITYEDNVILSSLQRMNQGRRSLDKSQSCFASAGESSDLSLSPEDNSLTMETADGQENTHARDKYSGRF